MGDGYEMRVATAAYRAAKEAQRAIDEALAHGLVRLIVKCTDPVVHSDMGYRSWCIRHPVWFAEGAVHIPLDDLALARRCIGNDQVDEYARQLIVAAEKIRNAQTAIDKFNGALSALVDFDVIVHTSFDDDTSQIRLSVLKRFPNPPNEEHEKRLRQSMTETIEAMREKGHKDLSAAEDAFYQRFGELCPNAISNWHEEIAADGNLDSQPNYNDTPRL